jgi:hypothetical protein
VCCEATAAGAFSFWSLLGLFVYWYRQQWGGIFFGGRSEGIFLCLVACLLAVFQKRIMFGGAGPTESMAGETSQQRN